MVEKDTAVKTIATMLQAAEALLDFSVQAESIGTDVIAQSVILGGHVDYGIADACRDLLDEYKEVLDEQYQILRDQLNALHTRIDYLRSKTR